PALLGLPGVGAESVRVKMNHARSLDARTKEGGVVSEPHARTVSPDLDSIQHGLCGKRFARERALRGVHDDLVSFPDQIPGKAEDMRLHATLFGGEVRHDMMDVHDRPRSVDGAGA